MNLKNDAIYGFYPESFCDKNLAIRKVFAFSDSAEHTNARSRNRSQHSVDTRTKMVTHKCEREIGKPQKQSSGLGAIALRNAIKSKRFDASQRADVW